jgi:hypothetical protein
MSSSDSDAGDVLVPCPVCGEELAELDEMWRRIHINGCLAQAAPAMLQRCQTDKCPICSARLRHLSAQLATRHVNECMDRRQQRVAAQRPSERCPFCGLAIHGMSERQRRLHDQMCRKADAVTDADVVQYPKVVEALPTPADWETAGRVGPVLVEPVRTDPAGVPRFGTLLQSRELQSISGYEYSNCPFRFVSPVEIAQGLVEQREGLRCPPVAE